MCTQTVNFGLIGIELIPSGDHPRLELPAVYQHFTGGSAPDTALQVHYRDDWSIALDRVLFQVEQKWTLGLWQGKKVLLKSNSADLSSHALLLEPDLSSGEVFCLGQGWLDASKSFYPLLFPVDMLLSVNLLARGKGIAIHAAAVDDRGIGRLFVGRSGQGKSTMARLWHEHSDGKVLNDDRVLIGRQDGAYRVHGTPWHSSLPVVSSSSVPLDAIYVIHHADQNCIIPLSPIEAAARLMAGCFTTYWDPEGMAFTLDFLAGLVASVPCFELGFRPDPEIVDFVRG